MAQVKTSVKFIWRTFWLGLVATGLLLLAAYSGVFGKMPSLKQLENPEADLASEIYSADGVQMGKFYNENRSEVKYHEISPNVIHALIATEDERFYEHSGIDAQALARALFSLGKDGGGSTITQQLAKMILGQGSGNIVARSLDKLKEWIVAVRLERNFTKEEIIALYLNRAPWGNIFGIRNAARTFFQKEPANLKIEEAAVLVGMLKGPTIYDPVRRPKNSIDRRNVVLNQMVVCRQKYLTPAEAKTLMAKPLITNFKKIDEEVGLAPYFRRGLLDFLKAWAKGRTNPKTGEDYNLYRDGLKIYTTINSKMQVYAEEATAQHMPKIQAKLNASLRGRRDRVFKGRENVLETAIRQSDRWKGMKEDGFSDKEIRAAFDKPVKMKVFTWSKPNHEVDTTLTPLDSIKYQKLLMQTSFVAMDPRSGEVKAWVGGIDYKWFKFDHVTAKRQVGSTFKPILYTLAVKDAGYTPETVVPGGSLTLGGKTITGGGGTLANGLAYSKNAVAWRLMSVIGVKRTLEFSQQIGIKTKLPPYPSIALGSAEIPMLEMMQAYSMFPNKGYSTTPILVTRIEDKNGNLIYEFPLATSNQVIGEGDAYTMVKLMQGVVQAGTGKVLNSYNIPVQKAGKTGTTNDNTDGWFIGYTPELLAGTWVGCDDPFIPIFQNTAGGSEMSAPRWGIFMSKVYNDKTLGYNKKEFDEPLNYNNDPVYADARFAEALGQGEQTPDDLGDLEYSSDLFGDGALDDQNFNSEIDTSKAKNDLETEAPQAKPKLVKPEAEQKNNQPQAPPQQEKKKNPLKAIFKGNKNKDNKPPAKQEADNDY